MAVVLHTAENPEKKIQINQADVSNKLRVTLNHLSQTLCDKKKICKERVLYRSELFIFFYNCILS